MGNSKNAGKTTVINSVLQGLNTSKIAITSIGFDGEQYDQVNFMEKPRILVKPGYIVVTAENTLEHFEAEYKVLEKTDISTSIGHVFVCEIKTCGNALIAGPSTNNGMSKMIKILEKYDLKHILIDGAFSRQIFAKISNATILIIGANFHRNIDEVVDNAESIISKFKLKKPPFQSDFLSEIDNITLVNDVDNYKKLEVNTALKNTANFSWDQSEKYRFLYLPKSLTNILVENLISIRNHFHSDIIVNSPLNIQLSKKNLSNLWKLKNKIYTLNPVNLIAVCYNPFSPKGYEFNDDEFKAKLEHRIDMNVYNVKKEVTHE